MNVPYSGLYNTVKYLNSLYRNTLLQFGLTRLIDRKIAKFYHLLDISKFKDLYLNKLLQLKKINYNFTIDCNTDCSEVCSTQSSEHYKKNKNLNNNILFESTPRGNVIVYYNTDEAQFDYYCDYSLTITRILLW